MVQISFSDDTIFAAFYPPDKKHYWLVAEADDSKRVVAGFLVGNEYGGRGRIDLERIRELGAIQILPWKPCSLEEAADRVREHLARVTTKDAST
jgi:hypothetical protein